MKLIAVNLDLSIKNTVCINSIYVREIMLRQSDINQAFRESILRNSKGYQYLHTRDFVSSLCAEAFISQIQRLTAG
jgi:hypothetical protein